MSSNKWLVLPTDDFRPTYQHASLAIPQRYQPLGQSYGRSLTPSKWMAAVDESNHCAATIAKSIVEEQRNYLRHRSTVQKVAEREETPTQRSCNRGFHYTEHAVRKQAAYLKWAAILEPTTPTVHVSSQQRYVIYTYFPPMLLHCIAHDGYEHEHEHGQAQALWPPPRTFCDAVSPSHRLTRQLKDIKPR